MTEKHLESIRSRPLYHHAYIFVYIESQYSVIEAGNVRDIVQQHRFAPVAVESQIRKGGKQPRLGVMTMNEEKKLYAQDLAMVLSHGQLLYPEESEFISSDSVAVKEELLAQLRQYRRETKMTHQEDAAFADVKETYSGKAGGRKDDLCMALQIALFHGMRKRQSDGYEQLAMVNGWRL